MKIWQRELVVFVLGTFGVTLAYWGIANSWPQLLLCKSRQCLALLSMSLLFVMLLLRMLIAPGGKHHESIRKCVTATTSVISLLIAPVFLLSRVMGLDMMSLATTTIAVYALLAFFWWSPWIERETHEYHNTHPTF